MLGPLLSDGLLRQRMSSAMQKLARPIAAADVAGLLLVDHQQPGLSSGTGGCVKNGGPELLGDSTRTPPVLRWRLLPGDLSSIRR